ncbi:MAG TPA: hypothetical protein VK524_07320 [Polyangiaceae bacterium]|nr:hypothetical protein [Polyangiaceae bacterium]
MPVYATHIDRALPPPLWLVKNGENVSGPVPTWLLLHGISHGRLPADCRVRQPGWSDWRNLSQIREVGQWRRRLARAIVRPHEFIGPRRLLDGRIRHAQSASEVLLFTLTAARVATSAEVGAATRINENGRPPTTTSVCGAASYELLGLPVAASDLALGAARAGRSFCGARAANAVHQASAERLGRGGFELAGVAMLALHVGPEPFAMIELGRFDHPFRRSDGVSLERLRRAAVERLRALNS